MEILQIVYRGKELNIPFEIEDISTTGKISCEYYVYGKKGNLYVFKQSYKQWELVRGLLADDLANAIIDALIYRFEKETIGLCYYDGVRQLISIYDLNYIAQEYAYSLLVNNIDLGYLIYTKDNGWRYDLRVKLTAQWFGTPEIEIITEMIENGEISWVRSIKK